MSWIRKIRRKHGFRVHWALRFIVPLSLLIFAFQQVPIILATLASGSFASVPGRMIDARPNTAESFNHFVTTLALYYEYTVDGQTYKTDTYNYFGPFQVSHSSPWGKEAALQEELNRKFGPNAEITVWYDPENPGDCVLQKGGAALAGHWASLLILPLGIIASIFLWVIKPKRPARRSHRRYPSELPKKEPSETKIPGRRRSREEY